MDQAQRVAVITGAGSGIGREVAQRLLAEGWATAVAGRREAGLRTTVADHPESALVLATDVTEPAAVRELFERVRDRFGRVDLLFNNAGQFGPPTALDELSFDAWKAVLDTNLTGSFLCAQEAFRTMKHQRPQGGRIINNGSVSAQAPRPLAVAYTASKHAITGLTKAISLEGRPYSIACGQIDVGNARTELTAGIASGARQADGSMLAEPMMPVGHAADAVLFMAGLPLDANVQFMTVMATTMPLIGRG